MIYSLLVFAWLFLLVFQGVLLLLLEVLWELETIIDHIWILWKWSASLLEYLIHDSYSFLVGLLKLRVKHVDNVLDGLVRDNAFKWSTSQMNATLWAILSVHILTEILEDT